jgi:hypothetical protein
MRIRGEASPSASATHPADLPPTCLRVQALPQSSCMVVNDATSQPASVRNPKRAKPIHGSCQYLRFCACRHALTLLCDRIPCMRLKRANQGDNSALHSRPLSRGLNWLWLRRPFTAIDRKPSILSNQTSRSLLLSHCCANLASPFRGELARPPYCSSQSWPTAALCLC